MRHIASIIPAILLLCAPMASAKTAVKVEKYRVKSETSFAIITDSRTLEECSDELRSYKDVLEKEGLGTYIISADWTSPDEVKAQIRKIAGKKPRLEGVVFVGDVPVVMVRGGQHMTTAFKMNEETFPIFESSVASDRFYDDFDLDFEFIAKDTVRSNTFYYRLTEKGAQHLDPDIYSARMKVPQVMSGDKYEIMRRYLRKVVAAHEEQNPLDDITFFAGHGYNSDCLTIWRQKPVVFREYFPYAFDKASHNRFLNFREKKVMKWNLLSEVARPDVDLFVFSEHGAFDTQYINGSGETSSTGENIEYLKRQFSLMYRRYYKGGRDEQAYLHEVDSIFHMPAEIYSDSLVRVYKTADSLETANMNIYLPDIMKGRSSAKMIIFNACYNGSFHNPDGYVAGCHVFGDGGSIVAQGNTINVLQDKWEDKLIGYLSIGERVGMWQKEVPYLESHLIGDPTYRFTAHDKAEAEMARKLHHDLVFNEGNASVWEAYTRSDNALLRSAGITHLVKADLAEGHSRAKELLDDPSWIVRIHAYNAVFVNPDADCGEVVRKGLDDIYELVVRTSAKTAGNIGDTSLVKDLEAFVDAHPEMQRAGEYAAVDAISVLTPARWEKTVARCADKSLSASRRISDLRLFRNNRANCAVDTLLGIVADSDDDLAVRKVACEALGWYRESLLRGKISDSLTEIQKEQKLPKELSAELTKTVKRLAWK